MAFGWACSSCCLLCCHPHPHHYEGGPSNHSDPQSFISGSKESPVFLVKKQKEALGALKWYRREGGDEARS